jgi:hypothetical protein
LVYSIPILLILILFRPKFRSYVPSDEKLKEGTIAPAKPGDVESEVKDQLEAAKSRVVIEDLVSKHIFYRIF